MLLESERSLALREMEHYVNGVVKDWERGRSSLRADADEADLHSWTRMRAFLDHGDQGTFTRASSQIAVIEAAMWPDLIGNAPTGAQPKASESLGTVQARVSRARERSLHRQAVRCG
jgi:hypothetical protein